MKTLIEKIGAFIDKAGKLLNRFKTIGGIVVILALTISLVGNGCERQRANQLFERVTGLNIENDILLRDIKDREAELERRDSLITDYEKKLYEKEVENLELKKRYTRLKIEFEKDVRDIINIPVDSSYNFLTMQAYPYLGEKKFPFNEPQVRNMHLTYLERFSLLKEQNNLLSQIENYESQLLLQEDRYLEKEKQYAMMRVNSGSYEEIIQNKDEEIFLKDKEIAKKSNRSLFWKVTAAVIAAIAIIK